MKKSDLFKQENKLPEKTKEYLSPSGNYKLVVEHFHTGKNTWGVSQGSIYNIKDNTLITIIQRNYDDFPFLWIEDHTNNHNYIICGEDYQGQSVIELDTKTRKDFLPEEAKQGAGFCWRSYEYIKSLNLLKVCGCYWACSDEYKFYDFSNPMNGWPLINVVNNPYHYLYDYYKEPDILDDGTIIIYQTISRDDEQDYVEWLDDDTEISYLPEDTIWEKRKCWYDENDYDEFTIVATRFYQYKDGEIHFIREDITEAEKKYRQACEEANNANELWKKQFSETDPLCLELQEQIKDPVFNGSKTIYTGQCYKGWYPSLEVNDKRWGCVIHNTKNGRIELEWAIKSGPIKVNQTKDGKCLDPVFFEEHSVESMQTAFDYIRKIILNDQN